MQKKQYFALLLMLGVLLCGCTRTQDDAVHQTTIHTEAPETTQTMPTETALPETTEPATLPETIPPQPSHSEPDITQYSLRDILDYFEEVVLNVEYTDGTGADDLVKKWEMPIYYLIYGEPTGADLQVLYALCDQLNAISGFPGIYPAEDFGQENMSIHFLEPEPFRDAFSSAINGEEAYGATEFWYYTLTNELHTARIGCRMDVDQAVRNSVLVEEIINSLGISDTVLREDSITYQYSDENTSLSDMDLLILWLLYHPSMQCGFDLAECTDVIQDLYYASR